ncbi:MAG: hypothetical protein ABW067_06075 [Rhizobacter sp.]
MSRHRTPGDPGWWTVLRIIFLAIGVCLIYWGLMGAPWPGR